MIEIEKNSLTKFDFAIKRLPMMNKLNYNLFLIVCLSVVSITQAKRYYNLGDQHNGEQTDLINKIGRIPRAPSSSDPLQNGMIIYGK